MMIPSKPLPRRTILRGLGAAVALPLLDSMVPSVGQAATAIKGPRRLSIFYMPNGMIVESFVPKEQGANYAITPTLRPLESMRDKFTVITGMADVAGTALGDGPGDHGRCCASYLTAAHPKKTEGYDLRAGISMDQLVAQQFAKETQLASLELGIEPPSFAGSCDSGYSCAYTNTLSWSNATTPLPITANPREVFERLFGDSDNIDQKSRLETFRNQASILDAVMSSAKRMQPKLSADDKRKMDEYTTAIRDLERRIQMAESGSGGVVVSDMTRPAGIPDNFNDHMKMMMDLQILALRADMTRVTSLMVGREVSMRSYTEIGIADAHHSLSHHGGDPEKIAKVQRINELFIRHYAYYLKQLNDTKEGDASLLDRTVAMAGSSLGDPNHHDHLDLPTIVAGAGLKGNRHIVAKDVPFANLLVSVMNTVGVNETKFGDSTGAFTKLTDA